MVSPAKKVAAPAKPVKRTLLQRIVFKLFGEPIPDPHLQYILEHPDEERLPGLNQTELKRLK
jgi:hypothetical protein